MESDVKWGATACFNLPRYGASCNNTRGKLKRAWLTFGMLLTRYITCILITQWHYGTFWRDFSIFKTLILTNKLTNSANFVHLDEVKCICSCPSCKMAAIFGFSIYQSDRIDLITIEMSHANFGACISQFARFTPKMRPICFTVRVLQPARMAMLQHAQRHLAHEMCNCKVSTIPCTLHLPTYIQGSVYSQLPRAGLYP